MLYNSTHSWIFFIQWGLLLLGPHYFHCVYDFTITCVLFLLCRWSLCFVFCLSVRGFLLPNINQGFIIWAVAWRLWKSIIFNVSARQIIRECFTTPRLLRGALLCTFSVWKVYSTPTVTCLHAVTYKNTVVIGQLHGDVPTPSCTMC